jgi:hypothetical protein
VKSDQTTSTMDLTRSEREETMDDMLMALNL